MGTPLWVGDEQHVERINITRCEGFILIAVDLARPAIDEAVVQFLSFGWSDVARGAFRPKTGGRRTRFGRAGSVRGRSGVNLEFGNKLGNLVRNFAILRSPVLADAYKAVANKRKFIIAATDLVATVGLIMLIADIVDDFLANWNSGIIGVPEGIQCEKLQVYYRGNVNGVLAIQNWHGMLMPDPPNVERNINWNNGGGRNEDETSDYTLFSEVKNISLLPLNYQLQGRVNIGAPATTYTGEWSDLILPGQTGVATITFPLGRHETFAPVHRVNQGAVTGQTAIAVINGGRHET